MLNQNKISKYLVYAVGEILLVVIGILIALQLNNWKEFQTNRREEQFYLKKLERNIAQDTLYLENRLYQIRRDLVHLNSMQNALLNDNLNFRKDSSTLALMSLYRFTPQKSTFDNLISTGKLELIQDDILVDSIFIYYNALANFTEQYNNAATTYTRNEIGPYMMKQEGGLFRQAESSLDFRQDHFILNATDFKIFVAEALMDVYTKDKVTARALIKRIKQNITIDD